MLEMNNVGDFEVSHCSLCYSNDLEVVIGLNDSPIADSYSASSIESQKRQKYPLRVNHCAKCGHLQLSHHIPTDVLYGNYTYRSSISKPLLKHFENYTEHLIRRFNLDQKSFVVDIGSNDGSFLKNFTRKKIKVLGVDPASTITSIANDNCIPTICSPFSTLIAKEILKDEGSADLVTANNVFAHISNINEIIEAVDILLSRNGSFVFEVSYIPDIIQKNLFDTIYHEHLFYYYLHPLKAIFEKYNFEIFDYDRVNTKGGSIRVFVRRQNSHQSPSQRVQQLINMEASQGYLNKQMYKNFNDNIRNTKNKTIDFFGRLIDEGRTMAGYGASATVTTLLHSLDIINFFEYLIDDNLAKQGLFAPGTTLQVKNADYFYAEPTNMVCVLAWNYADLIMERNYGYKSFNCSFIKPLPNLEVY